MHKWILGLLLIFSTLAAFAAWRDPTMPADYNGETPTYLEGQFQLQSILISKNRRLVVINNHFYSVGDIIDQHYKVIAINDNNVILLGPKNKQITLQILPEIVKKLRNRNLMDHVD